MTDIKTMIDETMPVAPGPGSTDDPQGKPAVLPRDAGHDESIEQRLKRNPENKEARLDRALDESMDASDPPASTQPVHSHEPPASSGYDEDAERALKDDR